MFDIDQKLFTPKQIEFILHANTKFNIADGSVRSGKTVGVLFRFMQAVYNCPGDQIWMVGYTQDSIYHNCVRLFWDNDHPLGVFGPYCTWQKSGILNFLGKTIYCLGASNERALGPIQGKVFDLVYCNEMTIYPPAIIEMISTRLSKPHSQLFCDMNPVHPTHVCKKWIDFAKAGDEKFYNLHFTLDDNPFLEESFKEGLRQTLTGLFYRRNYLGEWCLAQGAIFDFFDHNIHVDKQKKAVDYWVAGIDYGASNAFAVDIIGVKQRKYENDTQYLQVQDEYYYDPSNKRTKTNGELARDCLLLFERYPVREVYLDPSAASFKAELNQNGIRVSPTSNEVLAGITLVTSMVSEGQLSFFQGCKNLIREIEAYSWDSKASAKGEDKPLKLNDHAIDACRYGCMGILGNKEGSSTFNIALPRSGNLSGQDFGKSLGHKSLMEGRGSGQTHNNFGNRFGGR